ncbi:unnamed protein product [Malus baccata var. baccata]
MELEIWKEDGNGIWDLRIGICVGMRLVIDDETLETKTRKTWLILEEQFALASQKHISQLRSYLRRTTNVDGSIAEFLSGVNAIAHELELVGSPVPETKIIDVIMENVGRHYKNEVIRRALSLDKPITYKDLEALLLAAETRFEDCSNNTVLAAVAVFVIIMLVGLVEYNKF